jgi:hypothetical protein
MAEGGFLPPVIARLDELADSALELLDAAK